MPALADQHDQAVTGVASHQMDEAIVRDSWQSITAHPGPAGLARKLHGTYVLAPVGWMVLAPFFLMKFLALVPGLSGMATRYRLTNRRLMICKGFKAVPEKEVPLDRIKDVKLVNDVNSDYYFSGTLEVMDEAGHTILSLPGVHEPESLRQAIMQAAGAWGPALKASKK